MKLRTPTRICTWAVAIGLIGLPGMALAKTDMSKFPLAKALPADAFIGVAAKYNPERKFLDDYWGKVGEALKDSGVGQDVWDLVSDMMPDDQVEKVEEVINRFKTHFKEIPWSDMLGKEMIHAGRLSSTITAGSPYEGILIGRMDAKSAETTYTHLKGILDEIVKLSHEAAGKDDESPLSVEEAKGDLGTHARMMIKGYPGGSVLSVGYKGDLIIISFFGDNIVKDCMGLLKGDSEKTSLIDSKRFKAAVDELHEAEDSVTFFDLGKMLNSVNGMIKVAQDMQQNDEEAKRTIGLVRKIINDLAMVDHVVSVEWTDGYRTFHEAMTSLTDDCKSRPLYNVLNNGKTAEDFARFIPKKAHSFSVSSGINMTGLYRYILGFVEEATMEEVGDDADSGNAGDAEKSEKDEKAEKGDKHDAAKTPAKKKSMVLEQWAELQKSMELDVEKDICGLFEGPMTAVNLGREGKDWVVLLKVTDEKKAMAQIKRLLDTVNQAMGGGGKGGGGGLILTPVTVAGKKDFTQISHPMMMMMGGGMSPPVVGCAEGQLIIGSSAQTITECVEVAKGEAPSIKENKRFKDEVVMTTSGKINSISYTDESKKAAELQEAVGAMGMGLGMVSMFGGQQMPKEAQTFFGALPPILGKLVPVVGEMDFFQSTASVSSFDGQHYRTQTVQNYKAPGDVKKYKKPAPKEGEKAEKADHKAKASEDAKSEEKSKSDEKSKKNDGE